MISAEGFDFVWLATGLHSIPSGLNFRAVLERPFYDESKGPAAHPSGKNLQCADFHGDFLVPIDGVEMGNVAGIFARAKQDLDSEKFAEFWHGDFKRASRPLCSRG